MSPGGVHENLEETKLIVGVCFWVAGHDLNEEFTVTWKDAALCLLTHLLIACSQWEDDGAGSGPELPRTLFRHVK